jgi:hypothetical protein
MKKNYKLLKTAAAELKELAQRLESAHKELAQVKTAKAKAEAELTQVKTAQAAQVKTAQAAEATKAKLAGIAKTAADKLLNAGLLSNTEKRDQFASELLDHSTAIEKIAKLAEFVQVPKLGKVVAEDSSVSGSEATWAKHASATISRLNLR